MNKYLKLCISFIFLINSISFSVTASEDLSKGELVEGILAGKKEIDRANIAVKEASLMGIKNEIGRANIALKEANLNTAQNILSLYLKNLSDEQNMESEYRRNKVELEYEETGRLRSINILNKSKGQVLIKIVISYTPIPRGLDVPMGSRADSLLFYLPKDKLYYPTKTLKMEELIKALESTANIYSKSDALPREMENIIVLKINRIINNIYLSNSRELTDLDSWDYPKRAEELDFRLSKMKKHRLNLSLVSIAVVGLAIANYLASGSEMIFSGEVIKYLLASSVLVYNYKKLNIKDFKTLRNLVDLVNIKKTKSNPTNSCRRFFQI